MRVQAVQAGQITFEDYFMADLAIAPLQIVGWEGVLGALFMAAVLLPVVSVLPGPDGGGIHEDSIDSLHVRYPTLPCPHLGTCSCLLVEGGAVSQRRLGYCTLLRGP